jgi:hypothetical protein
MQESEFLGVDFNFGAWPTKVGLAMVAAILIAGPLACPQVEMHPLLVEER